VSLIAFLAAVSLNPMTSEPLLQNDRNVRVLVFSKTAGFRHDSIPVGIKTIQELNPTWRVTATEDSAVFTDAQLKAFDSVVFLNTTGDIMNDSQQAAFQKYIIEGGGGFVGVHAAADTEYGWPWYGSLCGAYFLSHPDIQPARVNVIDRRHPATQHLPAVWTRTDEWYDYKERPAKSVRILALLDTTSYRGHKMGDPHPIMWCQEVGKGRSFYTGFGHTKETFAEPEFRVLLTQAILWSAKRTRALR
jgi:type 1 glutamine amidotransferase